MRKSFFILLFLICFIICPTKIIAQGKDNRIAEHPIFNEIKNGNLNEVQRMINNGFDINYRNDINETLLCYAVKNNQEKIVQFLLDNHADVDSPSNANAPIVYAANNRNLKLINLLLKYGADINSTDRYHFKGDGNGGDSAILGAIVHNDFEIVDFLLSNGADINKGTYLEGEGAAILLVSDRSSRVKTGTYDGDLKMLDYILSKGFNPNQEAWFGNALSVAVQYEDIEAIQILLKYNAEINEYVDGIHMTIKELMKKSSNKEIQSFFADTNRYYLNGNLVNEMYVNSKEGLRVRQNPSLNSSKLCTISYNFPVKIISIGSKDTIDNISDSWIKILLPCYEWKSDVPEFGWVFGGYLSNSKNIHGIYTIKGFSEFILSQWISDSDMMYWFNRETDEVEFLHGKEGSGGYYSGTWEIRDIGKIFTKSYFSDEWQKGEMKNEILSINIINNYTIEINGSLFYRRFPYFRNLNCNQITNLDFYKQYMYLTYAQGQSFYQILKKEFNNYSNWNKNEIIQKLIKYGIYDSEYEYEYNNYWKRFIDIEN